MTIQLTPDQQDKFTAIKWLLDPLGNIGSGRTQLLAMTYLQHAMKTPIWIPVTNHGLYHPMAEKELFDRIKVIAGDIPDFDLSIRHHDRSIMMKPKEIMSEFYLGRWKNAEED